ncbi:MAG: FeoB-associated Cys-rich membrane protein [Candidatus Hydrogenedens sp.]|nr:FeoB-associated Cys-rich membrane protein [Candidatus Hydrogenedentota bacterium]NLF58471.1 FeoB-associated Cys-rich membrane protein [Candidatus Hydrogenedens sp.]
MPVEQGLVALIVLAAAWVVARFFKRSTGTRENPCGTCSGCPQRAEKTCDTPPEMCGLPRQGGKALDKAWRQQ